MEFGPPPALPVAIPPAIVAMLESFVTAQLRILAPSGTVRMGLDALKLPQAERATGSERLVALWRSTTTRAGLDFPGMLHDGITSW